MSERKNWFVILLMMPGIVVTFVGLVIATFGVFLSAGPRTAAEYWRGQF